MYITPYFKGKDITKITKAQLLDWQNYIWQLKNNKTNQDLSWKYRCQIRSFMQNFLAYCEEFHNIPNLYKGIKLPKNKQIKKEIVFLEIDEFNSFIESVDDFFWKVVWTTFMFTGARLNEIRAFTDDDIGKNTTINKALTGKKIKVNKEDGIKVKATKKHKIVVKQTPKVLEEAIQKYKEYKIKKQISSKFLFGGDTHLSERKIRDRLNLDISKYNKNHDIKLKRITPHGFRHSYVSLLIHLGVSTKVIAELIGDTEEQILKTYGHLYKDAKNQAINLLDTKIST